MITTNIEEQISYTLNLFSLKTLITILANDYFVEQAMHVVYSIKLFGECSADTMIISDSLSEQNVEYFESR